MKDLISKADVLETYAELYDTFEDNQFIRKELNKVYDKLNGLPYAQPEPCEDAISRQRLLNDLKELIVVWGKYPVMAEPIKGIGTAIGYVAAIPSVTPKRKIGRWIEEQRGIKVTLYKCSECGRTVMDDTGYDVAKDFPFCHCGADMRGEQDEQHSV